MTAAKSGSNQDSSRPPNRRRRQPKPTLNRTTLRTSRLLDFCSRKELIAQTGHEPRDWPLVVLKELVDNSLDACEETEVAPEITITVNDDGITVADNGPGIPASTIASVLDFSTRVSSREPYVAPDRGAQGNALKTILAMPFVLDGEHTCAGAADWNQRVETTTVDELDRLDFGRLTLKRSRHESPGPPSRRARAIQKRCEPSQLKRVGAAVNWSVIHWACSPALRSHQ